MITRQLKQAETKRNSKKIKAQYAIPYSAKSNSRYKHIDDLQLESGITIKASMGPVNLSVFPFTREFEYIVQRGEEGRLDIIAYKTLGHASMWWAIAYRNHIYDPRDSKEVSVGKLLYIPTIESLRTFPNPLS